MGKVERYENHLLVKKNRVRIHDNAESDVNLLSVNGHAIEVNEQDMNDIIECILRVNKLRHGGE